MTVQFAREASSSGDVYGSPACNTGCVVDRSKASLLVKACGLPNTANWWTAKQDVNDIFSTPAWPLPVCLCCRCCLERRGDTRTSQGVWRVFSPFFFACLLVLLLLAPPIPGHFPFWECKRFVPSLASSFSFPCLRVVAVYNTKWGKQASKHAEVIKTGKSG